MLYGLFVWNGNTLRLPDNTSVLKDYPQICGKQSSIYPHIIKGIDHVIPQSATSDSKFIPLFTAGILEEHGIEIVEPEKTRSPFCLMFYPNRPSDLKTQPVIDEYWKSVSPMFVCRDIGGYYIGTSDDENIVFFNISREPTSQSLRLITSKCSEDLCYTETASTFSEHNVYIKRSV